MHLTTCCRACRGDHVTSVVGFPLKPGFPLKQVYVITQWFWGQIGSNVGQIFYMYGTFTR